MQREATILAAFCVVFCWSAVASGAEYLQERPTFLTPCKIHDGPSDKCISSAFENLFTNWKDGIPGLKNIGSIDPFHVKKIRLQQRTENLADIQVELKNVMAYGMSNTRILKSAINDKDYSFKLQLHLPSLRAKSDYKLKGRLLVLNLDGHGTAETQLSDVDFSIHAKANLKQVGDLYFFDITSISTDIKKIGKFHVRFTNLFNGNKELEDSAHALFNDNWQDIYEIMRPAFIQTFDTMIFDRYKKIFAYIPANYFVQDLP